MMKSSTKEIRKVADIIERRMVANGVVVQRYDSYTTNSVYLKFDGGLANSLRIGDHQGKKHLNYMFLVDVNYSGSVKITCDKFFQYTYAPNKKELAKLTEHILRHRIRRVAKYEKIEEYRSAVKKQFVSNSNSRGFWKQAKLIKSIQTEWLHESVR